MVNFGTVLQAEVQVVMVISKIDGNLKMKNIRMDPTQ